MQENDKPKKPRGSPPNPNAGSGVFTIRTRVAEQRAITKHARTNLEISANEFFLQAVRKLMPAMWIEQGEGRADICSKCGRVAISVDDVPLAVVKVQHEKACWPVDSPPTWPFDSPPTVATSDHVSHDSTDEPEAEDQDE